MAQPNVYIARLAQRLEEGGSETVIALDRLTTVTGEEINTSDFALFGRGIITINPDGDGSSSFPEFISFTGVNQADKALTGCVRGLSAKGNNVVEANKRFYPSGTRVAITFGYHDIQDIVNYIDDELGAVTVGTNANVTGIAGESLVAGNLVHLKNDGKWWKTVGTDQTTLFGVQLGIAQGSAVADANIPGGVMRKGTDDNLSGLTIGDTLYAGDTPGSIVNEAGTVERAVGVSRASDAWYFDPDYNQVEDVKNDTRYAVNTETRDSVTPSNDKSKLSLLEEDGKLSKFHSRIAEPFIAGEPVKAGDSLYVSDGDEFSGDDMPIILHGGNESGVITLDTPVPVANSFIVVTSSGTFAEMGAAHLTGIVDGFYTTVTVTGNNVAWDVISHPDFTVQTGTTTGNVSISPVNLSNSFVIFSGTKDDHNPMGRISFTSESEISVPSSCVAWYVVEWEGATVYSGTSTISSTSVDQNIGATITDNRTLLLYTWSGGGTDGRYNSIDGRFNSNSELRFERSRNTSNDVTIDWFVITHPLLVAERYDSTNHVGNNLLSNGTQTAFTFLNQSGNARLNYSGTSSVNNTWRGKARVFMLDNLTQARYEQKIDSSFYSTRIQTQFAYYNKGSRVAGRVYKTNATINSATQSEWKSFVGIALNDAQTGDEALVQISAVANNQTDLVSGKETFVSNKLGKTSATVGVNEKSVGRAIDGESFLIK